MFIYHALQKSKIKKLMMCSRGFSINTPRVFPCWNDVETAVSTSFQRGNTRGVFVEFLLFVDNYFRKSIIKMLDWVLNAPLRLRYNTWVLLVRILTPLYTPFWYLLGKTFLFFEKDKTTVGYVKLLCGSVSIISVQVLASFMSVLAMT